jgi:hypothetical protein
VPECWGGWVVYAREKEVAALKKQLLEDARVRRG